MVNNYRDYLLACLAEECGEVTQVVGKCLRFGCDDSHEKTGNVPNIELVEQEFNDLLAVGAMLGLIKDDDKILTKMRKVDRFYEYSKEKMEDN